MSIRIVHFSKTSLAGAPIRLVEALRCHTNYEVHLVDLERWGRFGHDLVYKDGHELVLELAEKADIIHLHNYLDYESRDFYPVDFGVLQRKGKALVRQFHSHPEVVAQVMKVGVEDVLTCSIPSLVIAQFQERYYPKARVVPNIVPQDAPLYRPVAAEPEHHVFYSPSALLSAWDDRWNSKGTTETLALLERVRRHTGCRIKWMTGQPLADVMHEKGNSSIIIDELITGSYHLSGLEGLSLGKSVLAFLDDRTQRVLREVSGIDFCPFINTRLEDGFEILVYLLEHPSEMIDIGQSSRAWIERYWADSILVQHFVDVYEKLLSNPELIIRQESLRLDDRTIRFQVLTLPDLIYQSRANRDCTPPRLTDKTWTHTRRRMQGIRRVVSKNLPVFLQKPLRVVWMLARRLMLKVGEKL